MKRLLRWMGLRRGVEVRLVVDNEVYESTMSRNIRRVIQFVPKYIDDEESEQRFVAVAEKYWADYEKTGRHISLDEAKIWAKKLKKDAKAVIPPCHK